MSTHQFQMIVISPCTALLLAGSTSCAGVGGVVSNIICFVTLYGLMLPLLNTALMFLVPSPGVKLIAWRVYGYGANSGTPTIFGFMSPCRDTLLAIFANNAAWSCVVLVYIFPLCFTILPNADWNSINPCICPGSALCTAKINVS